MTGISMKMDIEFLESRCSSGLKPIRDESTQFMSTYKINLKEQTATSINSITFKLTEMACLRKLIQLLC